MAELNIITKTINNITYIELIGEWTTNYLDKIEKRLLSIKLNKPHIVIDLTKVDILDTNAIILIKLFEKRVLDSKREIEYIVKSKKYKKLLEIADSSISLDSGKKAPKENIFFSIGKKFVDVLKSIFEFIRFLGELSVKSLSLLKIKNFRYKELIYFIYSSGVKAIPIVALTSFLVGVVIAYQTIVQLAKFGADIFVVDASAISIARELGPMITAIVVAGRSASSFTAEIGSMKLTQEIDAMKTMGFKPFYFLIFPRIFALIIALPILIFISDAVGIFGAMVATKAQIGLSFEIFIQRVYEVLSLKHYLIGIAKGPFFAVIIAVIGSFHGLRVTQNTESIGQETTKSVVNAIFLVIVCDAIFSVVFTRLGI